ncbi:MAG: hypothetical protein CM15mP40_03750 [Alphaproteobacteria bacterium]|nr:MAG: hypothetical protein CM15mP40_03750 [Alphaproteobacteria bacterium]
MHISTLSSIPNIKIPCKHVDISKIIDFTNQSASSKRELEYCPIFDFESLKPKLKFDHKKKFCNGRKFIIERKFLSKFGFPAYGVHCNVWSKFKNSTIIHLAKRSCKLDKFPGLYDNLIAGGQPIDLSIKKNFYKEAFEEAGLNQKQASHAKKSNTVHYQHNENTNFNSAIIFNYHLEKSDDMKFSNQDGEVESFLSIEIAKLYKILEKNSLKPNCVIPLIDFFILKESDFVPKSVIVEIKRLFNKNE